MISWILEPWPWWFSGLLVGLTIPLLFLLTGKSFGISTSFQQIGAMCTRGKGPAYLRDHDRGKSLWVLFFVIGIAGGGLIGSHVLSSQPIEFLPQHFFTPVGLLTLFIGGALVGFGARYAGGCTSGHSITGIANLNWPSLVATIFFFVGGLSVTWGLGALIFPQQ